MIEGGLHLFRLAADACGTKTGPLPSLYDRIPCTNGSPELRSLQDIFIVIGNLAQILIFLSGGLAVIFIMVGGVMWIISGGDPGRIKMGRDMINNAVLGLIIIIVAYTVVTFIAKGF
jgi:hypothetical protein